jgi:4-amino-4-deoxy-L-arabinose transferase-like glycosyltransferase
MFRRQWAILAAVALVLIMIAEVALSTLQESPSWDEGDHIYAGYMNWKHGEYDLNPEHPPLVKLIATLPLLPLDLKIAPRQNRFFKVESYAGGQALLFHNGPGDGGLYTVDTLLFRVHMAVLVFAVALAVLLFFAGNEMFGPVAGLIALALFVFDPTVLVNAPFVTTDTGAALGFFASVYAFYRFAKNMTWQRAVVCGLAVGIALVSKHSTVLLAPIFILLGAEELAGRWKVNRRWPGREAWRLGLGVGAIFAIALFVLWGVYSFRFAMQPQGVTMRSFAAQIAPLSPALKAILSFCEHFHLLPESYLFGFADVVRVGDAMPAYIFGKIYAHGQWFYFPSILSLKWSVGVLGLLALAIYAFATGKVHRSREVFFLALPALFYLAIAMVRTENIGVRHVLPIFPFAFALAGGGAAWLIDQRKLWLAPVAALLLWHVIDSVRMFPNYMPYANVFWGGPSKTNLYFTDSATEWGEELKWVKEWTDAHDVKECWIAYFPAPFLLPSDYGIPCQLLPTPDNWDAYAPPVVHGPLLVSYPDLNGFELGSKVRNPYQSLFERKPDDVIVDAVAVYYGDFSLPDASATPYVRRGYQLLAKHPQQALALARQAVAASPQGFDSNWLLGDALVATGNPADAIPAYEIVKQRISEMEPSARAKSSPNLEKDLNTAIAKTGDKH